jgi:tetratricopeptide (TPR) repeat protein
VRRLRRRAGSAFTVLVAYLRVSILLFLCFLPNARASGSPGVSQARTEAIALYEERRYGPAREAFRTLEKTRAPVDEELDFHLGRLALWYDDANEAVERLERAVRDTPGSARLYNALGDAYGLAARQAPLLTKLGWARKCLAAYRQAVELEPANPLFRWSVLGYYLVAPGIAGGGHDKALAEARRLKRLDDMAGRIALATVHLAESRNSEAFAQFDELCDARPDDFMVLYHIGRCAALSGEQVDRGIAALTRCLELEPPRGDGMPTTSSVHYRLASLHEARGDSDAATRLRQRAWELNPDFRPDKSALKN